MAKIPNSVIGVDVGRYAIKSVLLQRKGSQRIVLTHFASRVVEDQVRSADDLAQQLRIVFKELGGTAKSCAVAISSAESLIRIIEQPETPPQILRDALRFNGMTLLNQDCKDFVLDCDRVFSSDQPDAASGGRVKYLVAGLPRVRVAELDDVFQKSHVPLNSVQLGPVCAFNAFEFAHQETFTNDAFLLVDIGHLSSTVTVGVKKEILLVRAIDYGGQALLEALAGLSGQDRGDALRLLSRGDELMVENARLSLMTLTREITSSIGFFEGRREETIRKIFLSGGPARSQAVLKVITEELGIPCVAWNPFEKCEIALPAPRRASLEEEAGNLSIACGAAASLLRPH